MLCKNSFGLYTGNGAVYEPRCTVCVCIRELSLFHASHTGLRNKCPYYREEHAQRHLVLVHILALPAPWNLTAIPRWFCFHFSLFGWAQRPICFSEYGFSIARHRYQIFICPHIGELISNCRLLRMKLSHMSSRALVWSLIYPAAQEHTHSSQS